MVNICCRLSVFSLRRFWQQQPANLYQDQYDWIKYAGPLHQRCYPVLSSYVVQCTRSRTSWCNHSGEFPEMLKQIVGKNVIKVKALSDWLENHVHSIVKSYYPCQVAKKQDSQWIWSNSISSSARSLPNRFSNLLQSLTGSCSVFFGLSGFWKEP